MVNCADLQDTHVETKMTYTYSAVLLRYGEIAIKSDQTRRSMVNLLIRHLKTALKEKEVPYARIIKEYGRVFIETDAPFDAAKVASRIFGIVSTSPVVVTSSDLEEIINTGFEIAKDEFKPGLTFAVGARRVGTHPYTSQQVREGLGAKIFTELQLKVDLTNPEQSIYVEVRNDKAYILTKTISGIGGMPTGTQGKAICLISAGLDSAVAAFKVMKRGVIPIFLYFCTTHPVEGRCRDPAIKQATTLSEYIHNFDIKLYIIPHERILAEIMQHAPEDIMCIMCKRSMLRLAREVAIREGADAIVTGDIIGEQPSQTTANLMAVSSAVTDYPIFMPLAGEDNTEVARLAKEIGICQFVGEGLDSCALGVGCRSFEPNLDLLKEIDITIDHALYEHAVEEAQITILKRKNQ